MLPNDWMSETEGCRQFCTLSLEQIAAHSPSLHTLARMQVSTRTWIYYDPTKTLNIRKVWRDYYKRRIIKQQQSLRETFALGDE